MIEKIKRILLKKKLVDASQKIRFLKIPSKPSKNSFIPVLIFFGSQKIPSFIAMVFRNPGNADWFKRIVEKRAKIEKKLNGSFIGYALPEIFVYDYDAMLLIESYIEGQSLVPMFLKSVRVQSERYKIVVYSITEWLLKFHTYTQNGKILASQFSFYFTKREVDMLKEVFSSRANLILDYLDKSSDFDFVVPVTYCHGDFNSYNVKLVDNTIKVYDWEDLSEREIPLLDLYHLFTVPVLSNEKFSRDYSGKVFEDNICTTSTYKELVVNILTKYCDAFEIDKEYANWYYLVYLLKMCLKEKNSGRFDYSNERVWARCAISYVEKANGEIM